MSIINWDILYINDPLRGRPLFNGQIYVGEPDLDPVPGPNQKQLNIVQEDGTVVPVTQPFIISAGGVPMYNGSPVRLDVDGNYSIKVLDKNGGQSYYIDNVLEGEPVTEQEMIDYVDEQFIEKKPVFNFPTLQSVLDSTDITRVFVGSAINLKERIAGNLGGAMWDVYPTGTFTTSKIVVAHNALSLQLVMRVEGELNIQQWGLPGVSQAENAAIVNEICDYAYSVGTMSIRCDVDATIDPAARVQHKSNVIFYGNGSLNGLYRVRVHKTLSSDHNFFNNIKKENLTQFSKTLNPVVAIMGDSISTAGEGFEGPGGTIGFGSTMWSAIIDKIKSDNPNKNTEFYNRGIGGQTWLNANDNSRPSVGVKQWYTIDQPWLDYIEELEPDLLFLAFGMNDSTGFNAGALVATLAKITAWDKIPSIVFITTPVPSLAATFPDGEGFGFVGEVFQEGRDKVASFTRAYCDYFGYGCLDMNRQISQVRDGYDPCYSNLIRVTTDATPANGVYTATSGARDFNIVGEIQGNAASIKNIFDGVSGVLTCRVGLNTNDLVFINNSGDDTIQIQLNAAGLNSYAFLDTGVAFPTTDFTLTIDVSNTTLHVLLNGTKILETPIIRQAALFPVQFGYQGFATGPLSLVTFSRGQSVTVGKTSTDLEIWGVSNDDADVKLPNGGNGVNHYASAGIDKIVRPVLDQSDFSVGYYQDYAASPYPLTINEHFINWTTVEIDNWSRKANFATETVGGVHGSPTSAVFDVYPCGYGQVVTARMSRELAKYKLVVVAKSGSIFSNTSAGYVNPHSTIVILEYNDGVPQSKTINIPETAFGGTYESKEFDLEVLAGIDWPPLSQITKMELRIYMTNNCQLGYVGIHEADSKTLSFKNPLVG